MLRVGLTGELGSGKSTVARLLAERGAVVLSSDEMGRAMMQPGQTVYQQIIARFGPSVVLPNGELDRPALARLAFNPEHPRVEELNAIVHPAVLAEQERRLAELARTQPRALVVIESALLFTTRHAGEQPWRRRFDRLVLVTAPDAVKVERFVLRMAAGRKLSPAEHAGLQTDAQRRLSAQRIPAAMAEGCLVIDNAGSAEALSQRTAEVFQQLRAEADATRP